MRVGLGGITGTGILPVGLGTVSVGGGGGPSGPTPWVTVWQTTEPGETITLPFVSAGTYDVHVDWGDGSTDNITAYNDPAVTHAFATPGTQTIAITGVMTHWSFSSGGDKDKITAVTQAGTTGETLTSLSTGFSGCNNLAHLPNGTWTKNVTTFANMLRDANDNFNADISGWDTSSATNLSRMFSGVASFNVDISGWDVSNTVTMEGMLAGTSFDHDIGAWDVSKVANMFAMFASTKLSTANYDALLIGWSQRTLQNNVQFHGGNSQYSAAAASARQHIIDTYNWTITDGGLAA